MYIYKTTNNINGKIYIGKHYSKVKNYLGSGVILKLAIKKYGRKNFSVEIIEYCIDKKILSEREIYWIEYFNSRDSLIGYNITKGGEGNSVSKYWLNKKLTDEHKNNISKNHADVNGEKNPMYGKTHTDNIKEKLRILHTNVKFSEKTKLKQSEKRIGDKNSNAKLTNEIVLKIREEFNNGLNMKSLSEKYNVMKPCIWKIIHNYTWKHLK